MRSRWPGVLTLILIGVVFTAAGVFMTAGMASPRLLWRLMPFGLAVLGMFMIWVALRGSLSRYHGLSYMAVGAGSLFLAAPLLIQRWPAAAFFLTFGAILLAVGTCGVMYFGIIGLVREIGRYKGRV